MIDKSRPEAEVIEVPEFAPVPRQCKRHDGWTPTRQRGFIQALADLGSVRAAAHAVNMTPEGAYLLRRHPEAAEFREAWEAALALGVQRLEDVAMERALFGVEVPVYHFGAVVGTRRVYNDRLLMFMLRNRAPKRFAADSYHNADAASKGQLDRLKRDWRKEWQEEWEAKAHERSNAARASIDAKIDSWEKQRTNLIARAMRAEWIKIGGPPSIPGDEEDEDEDEDEDEEAQSLE
jgi:hypothetical protein